MEQREFDEADEILRRFVPVLPDDPAAALLPAATSSPPTEPAASTPALYWCNGTLYQKRSFVIAEVPDLVEVRCCTAAAVDNMTGLLPGRPS